MGKQDENRLRNSTNTEQQRSLQQSNSGITSSQNQYAASQQNASNLRGNVLSGYGGMPTSPMGGASGSPTQGGNFSDKVNALYAKYGKSDTGKGSGITDGSYWSNDALRSANGDEGYVLGRLESDLQGKGPDIGGGGAPSDDYLSTFRQISSDPNGGFDSGRLNNINGVTNNLRNFSGNSAYNGLNTAMGGLQGFHSTGGITDQDRADITNSTLRDIANTGGYSEADKANIRARSNAGIADTYQNFQDQALRQKAATGNLSPGYSAAGFKLARQAAQDIGQQAQGTEAGLAQDVANRRLSAAGALSSAGQGLASLRTGNQLQSMVQSGQMSLAQAKQVQDAMTAAGGLDLNTQQLINESRLAATSGLSQDALGRYGIDATNSRYFAGLGEQQREYNQTGLADMYYNDINQGNLANNMLYNYRNAAANQQQGILNGPMTNLANSKGWLDYATNGISAAAGFASPITKGISALRGPVSAMGGVPNAGLGAG